MMKVFEPLRMISDIRLPQNVLFGVGSLHRLGNVAASMSCDTVMVISGETIKKTGILKGIEEQLAEKSIKCDIYTDIDPDPSIG